MQGRTSNATDSDVDMNEALRRVQDQKAARQQAYAADLEAVRELAAAGLAANPGGRTARIDVWSGAFLTVLCPGYCTYDHSADAPMHPRDTSHCGDELRIGITDADGDRVTILTGHIESEPYSSWGPTARAVLDVNGDSNEYDLAALDQTIADFEQQVTKLHQLRAQLAEATR